MSAVGVACALAFLAVPEVRTLPRRGDAGGRGGRVIDRETVRDRPDYFVDFEY